MGKPKIQKPEGYCALTNKYGPYVKSHIIPEGLSETSWRGQPLSQIGQHGKLIRRWTSWYDERLVTQKGEDILQAYDDWGIKYLKKKRLVWRSWGPMLTLCTPDHQFNSRIQRGFRKIDDVDSGRLRLFLLSILWRAVACSNWEFKQIALSKLDMSRLTHMIKHDSAEPYHFLPISFIQFSTRPPMPFNHTIIKTTKREPVPDGKGGIDFAAGIDIDFYRLYFDGLVVSFNIDEKEDHYKKAEGSFLNKNSELLVPTMPASASVFINEFNFDVGLPVADEFLQQKLGSLREDTLLRSEG